jgi:hypothetical protein
MLKRIKSNVLLHCRTSCSFQRNSVVDFLILNKSLEIVEAPLCIPGTFVRASVSKLTLLGPIHTFLECVFRWPRAVVFPFFCFRLCAALTNLLFVVCLL